MPLYLTATLASKIFRKKLVQLIDGNDLINIIPSFVS
jgi:hypothetical protein